MGTSIEINGKIINPIIISLGVSLLGLTYYIFYQYEDIFYNSLFWLSIILIGLGTLLMLFSKNVNTYTKIILMLLFGSIIYIMNILPGNSYFHFPDELNIYETTKFIYEGGNLDIFPQFIVAKYYSALELITIFLKTVANLDIIITAKILMGMIHSFILIFLFLFFRQVVKDDNIAVIGTFIYATNPLYIFFHNLFVYETLGIFFGILFLYIFSISVDKNQKNRIWRFNLIIIIVLLSLTISHHVSSIMILLFLILFLVISIFYKAKYDKKSDYKFHYDKSKNITFLTFTLIFGWMIYVASPTIKYLFGHFIDRISKISEIYPSENSPIIQTSIDTALLPNYELIIDKYIYIPVLLLLSIIGIYYCHKYYRRNLFISTLVIFGPVLYILTIGFVLTSGQELAVRTWGFLYIGISLMVAICVNRLYNNENSHKFKKLFIYLAIILILIGGISIGNKPIHRIPSLLSPELVAGAGSMTTDVYISASWFENNFGKYNNMTGDIITSAIFSMYTDQYVGSEWQVFFPIIIDADTLNFLYYNKIDYIIVDKRITTSFPEYGMYFSRNELNAPYNNGRIRPLPKKNIEKFDNSRLTYKLYDNGNIYIYNINDKLKEYIEYIR